MRRARRAQARHPRTTLSSLLPTLYLTNRSPLHSVHALLPSPYSWDARRTRRARRAQARHPRTPPSSLLPILYLTNRSPLHSDHALSSLLYSLLPTLEAHCIVSTHFSLLPSPYSLLLTYCHTCDKPPVSCDDAWQMPLRMRTCLRTRVVRRFPRLSTGYMSMRLWPWP